MNRVKDISFATIGGATIAVAFIIGNIVRVGYAWDQLLIPFLFLAFKQKRKSMPIFWPAIIASIIVLGYKFYLGLFVLAYCAIAGIVYKFGSKITLLSITTISAVYVITYFGAWVIIGYFIHNVNVADLIFQVIGTRFTNTKLLTFILIAEPMAFAVVYQYMLETMQKSKMFND